MITIFEIMEKSKPHRGSLGGRQTIISSQNIEISIVGGAQGLYGDFVQDFELAIMDKKTHEFVTKFYYPEINDDVMGYLDGTEVEEIVNKVINNKCFRFF